MLNAMLRMYSFDAVLPPAEMRNANTLAFGSTNLVKSVKIGGYSRNVPSPSTRSSEAGRIKGISERAAIDVRLALPTWTIKRMSANADLIGDFVSVQA